MIWAQFRLAARGSWAASPAPKRSPNNT